VSEIAEQLSCQELVELVTDYLDGALPPAERARFDAHLAGCDGCRAYLEQIRVTIRLSGALRPEQLDPAAEEALLEAFRDWKSRP
jgi:anti-sigma factor RsiW